MERAQLSFANKQPPKKKRKSRTAFTNHQIFELEKRFLYQKYLSPADRDEIAATLGLSNAQVNILSSIVSSKGRLYNLSQCQHVTVVTSQVESVTLAMCLSHSAPSSEQFARLFPQLSCHRAMSYSRYSLIIIAMVTATNITCKSSTKLRLMGLNHAAHLISFL